MRETIYHNIMEYGYHGDCNIAYKVDKYYGNSYNTKEWYKYDVMNRLTDIGLTSILAGACTNYSSRITYDCNRIISKTGIGNYQYGGTPVNAVKQLLNGNNQLLNPNDCSLDYTSFHKVSSISEGDNRLFYTYGVDDNRVKSEYSDGVVLTTKYYAGSGTYEEIIQGSVKTQRYYIMGEDGCVAMYVKSSNSSTTKLYYVMKDHQGSVIVLVEDNNNSYTVRDRYSYDAWGLRRNDKQWDSYTLTKPVLTDRGFCGHEHLDGFNLINMTGRVYDPLLGVFLSPDPYVQQPDNTQGLNRYAYCMNNPVMYIDPDGEMFWLIPVMIFGGFANYVFNAMTSNVESFVQGLGYFAIGAISSGFGSGIGAGINVALAGGSFASGFLGTAGGTSSTGFFSGFTSAFGGGFAAGFVLGAGNSWMQGDSFGDGFLNGVHSGGVAGLTAGVIGGIRGGINALKNGASFWNGIVHESGGAKFGGNGTFLEEEISAGIRPTKSGEIAVTKDNPNYGRYGVTRNGGTRPHFGVDYVGTEGDEVFAMYDGKVIKLGSASSYDDQAVRTSSIISGKTYNVDYGHLSKHVLTMNQNITAGELIGYMGRQEIPSGFPTHVHIAIWRSLQGIPSMGFVKPFWK